MKRGAEVPPGRLPSAVVRDVPALLLLAGLAAAVGARALLAGPDRASASAAFVFGAALFGLAAVAPRRGRPQLQLRAAPVAWGLGGASGLVAGPLLERALGGVASTPVADSRGFAVWAAAVAVVAVGEEALIRGALWRRLEPALGMPGAIAVTAAAFAAVHLPLYGPRALPLDVVVGVWLGALRALSRSMTAPAIAHLLADWAGWWVG